LDALRKQLASSAQVGVQHAHRYASGIRRRVRSLQRELDKAIDVVKQKPVRPAAAETTPGGNVIGVPKQNVARPEAHATTETGSAGSRFSRTDVRIKRITDDSTPDGSAADGSSTDVSTPDEHAASTYAEHTRQLRAGAGRQLEKATDALQKAIRWASFSKHAVLPSRSALHVPPATASRSPTLAHRMCPRFGSLGCGRLTSSMGSERGLGNCIARSSSW
jgi:hypothetical protein